MILFLAGVAVGVALTLAAQAAWRRYGGGWWP